jgi:hypothetical protein
MCRRGGASIGATGANPNFIFGDKKEKREYISEKHLAHQILNLLE